MNRLCKRSTEPRGFAVFGVSPAYAKNLAQCIAQSIIILSLSHRDPYVLLIPALDLSGQILDQHIALTHHSAGEFPRSHAIRQLNHEVIRLRRNHSYVIHSRKAFTHPLTLCAELLLGCTIALFILFQDLHKEFCKRIDIPNRRILLQLCNDLCIAGGQHAKAQTWHTIRLRDALNDAEMRIRLEKRLINQRVLLLSKVHKGLVDNQVNALFTCPCQHSHQIMIGYIVA